jgi:hypothetical protein
MLRPAASARWIISALVIALLAGLSPRLSAADDLRRGQPHTEVNIGTINESDILDGIRFLRCAGDGAATSDFADPLIGSLVRMSQIKNRPSANHRKHYQLNLVFLI